MFADDMVLFTTDKHSLQIQLNSIADYAIKWGLKIDVGKSKICIFEKRKKVCDFEWSIGADILEVVDQFCYFGVNFQRRRRDTFIQEWLSSTNSFSRLEYY